MYKRLNDEILVRGIKKIAIANYLGISPKSLKQKIDGESPFTWEQVRKIQSHFFPDLAKDELFLSDSHEKTSTGGRPHGTKSSYQT